MMKKREIKLAQKKAKKAPENLKSSKFRMLNEQLYKSPSFDAKQMFLEEPELFTDVSDL